MNEFDALKSDFDPNVDPVTADSQGLAILGKLEEGKALLAGFNNPKTREELHAKFKPSEDKLRDNLARYRDYKVGRGEKLFSYQPEVEARKKALGEEELARSTIKLLGADTETFNSILEENGDTEQFQRSQALMQDKTFMEKEYKLRQLLKRSGYSDRQIDSGAAEPHIRGVLGADEESSEPTLGAFSRWSLSKINEIDRREKIVTSATELATVRFLGMAEDKDAFEEDLNSANPDLSDAERVELRAIRVSQQSKLSSRFKGIRPLVVESFNALARKEGFKSDFVKEGEENNGRDFWEVAQQIVKDVPEKDYPALVAMLAKTAELHGNNPAKDMDSFSRGLFDSAEKLGVNFSISSVGALGGAVTKAKERRKNNLFRKAQDTVADALGVGDKMRAIVDNGEKVTGEINKLRKFYGELARWQEAIVKTSSGTSGSLWQDLKDSPTETLKRDFVHGVGSSLPEMAAALTGPLGLSVIFQSKREENMQELRRTNPDTSEEELQNVADSAAVGYTGLSAFQGKILFGKMPTTKLFTNSILKGGAGFAGKLAAETLQESGQDAMLPLAQKLFKAMDADIKDVNLFGEGGEINEIINRAPSTAFASAPLILLGLAGSKGARYMDRRTLEGLMKNSELLDSAGFTEPQIDQIQNGELEQSIETIQQLFPAFLENASPQIVDFKGVDGISIVANPETNSYLVSSETQSLEVRTPEEAVLAVQQVDPEAAAKFEKTLAADAVDHSIKPSFETDKLHSLLGPDLEILNTDQVEPSIFRRDRLPPVPKKGEDTPSVRAKARYGLQKFVSQQPLPSKSLSKILAEVNSKAKGVETQFNRTANQLDKKISSYLKKTPDHLYDGVALELQENTYFALRGDKDALLKLPKNIRKDVDSARKDLDFYSGLLVEHGVVDGDLAKSVGDNIGSYVFRQFKAFDPSYKWTYNNVKKDHPGIYSDALNEIKQSQNVDTVRADEIIQDILGKGRPEKFYNGTASSGKISATAFVKKNNDLSPAILNLLGEIRNPATNIRESGKKASGILINYQGQLRMREQLHDMGLTSPSFNRELGHTYQIGTTEFTYDTVDGDGKVSKQTGRRVSTQFLGFQDTFIDPHIGEELDAMLNKVREQGLKPEGAVLRAMAGLTATGKFGQVILSPGSYTTNAWGGIGIEVYNGRVSFDFKGTKGYLEGLGSEFAGVVGVDKTPVMSVTDQEASLDRTNAEVSASGGVVKIPLALKTAILEQGGVLDSNVVANDLKASANAALGDATGAKKLVGAAGKLYQIPDNRAKRSAFNHELDKYIRAYPKETLRQAATRAIGDLRATTQNYDLVPPLLKRLSSHGMIVPTYVSFRSELIRTTVNTARLTMRELWSGNPVLMKAGAKRLAGQLLVASALGAGISAATAWFTELGEEDQEALDALKDPWDENSNVIWTAATDGKLSYFNPEYLVPQTAFYNALTSASREFKEGDTLSGFLTPLDVVTGFEDINIFSKTTASIISNKDTHGQDIYNASVDEAGTKRDKLVEYAYENMFQPGFLRLAEKMQKAKTEEVGFAGASTSREEIYQYMLGFRMRTKDTTHDRYLKDPLRQYAFANREISASINKTDLAAFQKDGTQNGKLAKLSKADAKKEVKAVEKARKDLEKRIIAQVRAFKVTKIPDEKILKALSEASVPKELRKVVEEYLSQPKD